MPIALFLLQVFSIKNVISLLDARHGYDGPFSKENRPSVCLVLGDGRVLGFLPLMAVIQLIQ